MIPWVRSGVTFANRLLRRAPVRCVASARLPTDYGEFDIHVFKNAFSGETHVALVRGEIGNGEHVLTRVHSACLTGDCFSRRDAIAGSSCAPRCSGSPSKGVVCCSISTRKGAASGS